MSASVGRDWADLVLKRTIIALATGLELGYKEKEVEICFQLREPDQAGEKAMIVCLCKGVSSTTIDAEVERGATTVGGVAKACQAGTGCGMCVGQIRDLIRLRTGDVAEGNAPDELA